MFILSSIPEYSNELAELARAFFPGIQVKAHNIDFDEFANDDLVIKCCHKYVDGIAKITIEYFKGIGKHRVFSQNCKIDKGISQIAQKRMIKNCIKLLLYDILEEYTGRSLDWGSLTGIRPTKIVHGLMDKGWDNDRILKNLYEDYRVSQKKAKLLLNIAKIQRRYFEHNHPNKISIYINIPICTTKCLFCSFPSATIGDCAHLVDDYILALEREMEAMSRLAQEKGIEIETVYIGGGTPTSLNTIQLEKILKLAERYWGQHDWKEYTVEGGRPDTMDEDKLKVLKDYNVSRISINPQTMSNKTLQVIGRNHRADQISQCFHMAREIGFDSINMDVIVGLPGEGIDDAFHTMEAIKGLCPDNFTVHTLAVKRASRLKDSIDNFDFTDQRVATEMMEIFRDGATSIGMRPYYLYRQKYMLGNMENVGFSVPSKESIYNMQIMEDQQTIWAFGAAAITKVCYPSEGRIERAANVKNIEEYIRRVEEMVERKIKLTF